jgi:hypothetical protein
MRLIQVPTKEIKILITIPFLLPSLFANLPASKDPSTAPIGMMAVFNEIMARVLSPQSREDATFNWQVLKTPI